MDRVRAADLASGLGRNLRPLGRLGRGRKRLPRRSAVCAVGVADRLRRRGDWHRGLQVGRRRPELGCAEPNPYERRRRQAVGPGRRQFRQPVLRQRLRRLGQRLAVGVRSHERPRWLVARSRRSTRRQPFGERLVLPRGVGGSGRDDLYRLDRRRRHEHQVRQVDRRRRQLHSARRGGEWHYTGALQAPGRNLSRLFAAVTLRGLRKRRRYRLGRLPRWSLADLLPPLDERWEQLVGARSTSSARADPAARRHG